jgi:hypothetical protein
MELKLNNTSISIIFSVVISVVGGVFYLGFSINSARVEHLKEIVDEYKNSNQLDAPGLLSSLRQSANALTLSASERHALDDAKARVDEYASRIGSCEAKLKVVEGKVTQMTEKNAKDQAQYSAALRNLKVELESYIAESSEIKVRGGVAVELIPNKVMLGVGSVYSSYAVININSETTPINIGESKKIFSDTRECVLWLTGLDVKNNEGTFKLNCPIRH